MMGLLDGKKGLIVGVANKRSIAWGIAQAAHREGAKLAYTYQGERLKAGVEELAKSLDPNAPLFDCDVADDANLDELFAGLKEKFGTIDFLVHAVAFAKREELAGSFLETSRQGHALALDISSYSLTALAKRAAPLMPEGGAIVAMTYYGAEKVIPRYNVMGVAKAALEASTRYLAFDMGPQKIRVNALSAGPVQTLAARGISGFTDMMKIVEQRAPLRRNVELREVADAAVFLLSPLSSGITGETLYVDCGYHAVGM
ncbi:MAG: enoyl-[acyl-carrier-protein] reductase FabI [Candidatus Omnitrophica bacterium CG11_big_fil_rev_8_21_14_0_20_64_10]|nr:MAG: enoyl-[acyl-carrier-protein] reductase FabI [Candidatus Omnitrophica bacterium CG11_big_fil_rev_8_21_14_0_20_64_10]